MFYGSTLQRLEELAEENSQVDRVVPVELVEMYEIIVEMGPGSLHKEEAMVCTEYKTERSTQGALEVIHRNMIYD